MTRWERTCCSMSRNAHFDLTAYCLGTTLVILVLLAMLVAVVKAVA